MIFLYLLHKPFVTQALISSCLLRRQLQADSTASGHTLLVLLKELLGLTKRRLLRHEQASTPAQQEKSSQFSVPVQASSRAAGMVGGWNHTSKESWFLSFPKRAAHSQLEAGAQVSSVLTVVAEEGTHESRNGSFYKQHLGDLFVFQTPILSPSAAPPPLAQSISVSSVRIVEKQVSLYN